MIGTIITGHAQFASGLVGAVKLLMGDVKIAAVDFSGENPDELAETILETVNRYRDCEQIYILCDILGGTPFKMAVTLTQEDEHIQVLYGANLDMAINLCMRNFDPEIPHQATVMLEVIQVGKDRIGRFGLPYTDFSQPD